MRPVVLMESASGVGAVLGRAPHAHIGSLSGSRLGYGLLALLAAFVVGPQLALAFEALSNPEVRGVFAAKPLVAVELALALCFWIALFAWPLKGLKDSLRPAETVTFGDKLVTVERQRGVATETLTLPASSFVGLSRTTKSSLSGVAQVLVLEHPDPSKSLCLLSAEHIPEATVRALADALDLPLIAPRARHKSLFHRGQSEKLGFAANLGEKPATASF